MIDLNLLVACVSIALLVGAVLGWKARSYELSRIKIDPTEDGGQYL